MECRQLRTYRHPSGRRHSEHYTRKHRTLRALHHSIRDEEVPEGETAIVYQQMPEPGQRLVEGETVTLRLSIHPDKAAHNRVQTTEEEDSWF